VKIPVTPLFREESARFGLRHACEDCAYFDLEREVCSHGYPTEAHRREASLGSEDAFVVFCKEWELA
jgi:hypothetical protein